MLRSLFAYLGNCSHGPCVVPIIVRLQILLVTVRWRLARPGHLWVCGLWAKNLQNVRS